MFNKKIKKIIVVVVILISLFMINNLNVVFAANSTYSQDATSIDSTFWGARNFVESGTGESSINANELKATSDFLYNSLLAIAMVIAVIVGMILGIKYMMGSAEEKAEYKQTLVVYLIGCVVIFGAFGIWKILTSIFAGMIV